MTAVDNVKANAYCGKKLIKYRRKILKSWTSENIKYFHTIVRYLRPTPNEGTILVSFVVPGSRNEYSTATRLVKPTNVLV